MLSVIFGLVIKHGGFWMLAPKTPGGKIPRKLVDTFIEFSTSRKLPHISFYRVFLNIEDYLISICQSISSSKTLFQETPKILSPGSH